jgi:hypothetical protein
VSERQSLIVANKLEAASLLVASTGCVLQIISGIEVPTIPMGLILMRVAAG